MDVKKSVCFLSWLDHHQTIMDVKALLQNFLTFFEKERDGRSRIGLHKPMQRLIEGSGLTLHQVRYILHQKESRARSRENVSFHSMNQWSHFFIIYSWEQSISPLSHMILQLYNFIGQSNSNDILVEGCSENCHIHEETVHIELNSILSKSTNTSFMAWVEATKTNITLSSNPCVLFNQPYWYHIYLQMKMKIG